MKKFIYILLVSFLLASCSAAHQYLKNGNYQAAIEVGAKKMKQNPKKADKTITEAIRKERVNFVFIGFYYRTRSYDINLFLLKKMLRKANAVIFTAHGLNWL